MSQADLDIIVRALAAGQRTAMALRNLQRHGSYYAEANDQLLRVQEGIRALERVAPGIMAAHVRATTPPYLRPPDPPAPPPPAPPAPAPAAPAPQINW